MTNIALIAVLTVVLLLLLYLFFMNRRTAWLRAVVGDVEGELATKLSRESQLAHTVALQLTAGTPTDQVVAEYQRERASILAAARTDKSWAWDKDDLESWRKREVLRRSEEVNRKLVVPAIASCLVVLAVAAVTITVSYNYLAPHELDPVAKDTEGPQDILSVPAHDSPPRIPLDNFHPVDLGQATTSDAVSEDAVASPAQKPASPVKSAPKPNGVSQ